MLDVFVTTYRIKSQKTRIFYNHIGIISAQSTTQIVEDYILLEYFWLLNTDDDGTTPQNPVSGQDNWFYARVHNCDNAISCSFVVGWKIKALAVTDIVFPSDWFPLTAVTVGFNLDPDEAQIAKARWQKTDILPVENHFCLLAMRYEVQTMPGGIILFIPQIHSLKLDEFNRNIFL